MAEAAKRLVEIETQWRSAIPSNGKVVLWDADLQWLISEIKRLTTECDALRDVVEMAKLFVAAPACCRQVMSFGHEACMHDGSPCDLHRYHELRYALAHLDALDS